MSISPNSPLWKVSHFSQWYHLQAVWMKIWFPWIRWNCCSLENISSWDIDKLLLQSSLDLLQPSCHLSPLLYWKSSLPLGDLMTILQPLFATVVFLERSILVGLMHTVVCLPVICLFLSLFDLTQRGEVGTRVPSILIDRWTYCWLE